MGAFRNTVFVGPKLAGEEEEEEGGMCFVSLGLTDEVWGEFAEGLR
jgi:hypothetical protein